MKNKVIHAIAFLGTAALVVGCQTSAKEKETQATEAQQPALETFAPKKEILATELRMPAEITGFQQVDIYAKVSSYVKELKADIGTQVKKGQLLMVLEAPELSAQLSAAQSRLKSQEAVYTASRSTYNRLFETSKVEGTVSRNDLEVAEARKNSDFAQYQAAKAAYNEIQTLLGYLLIRAPFDGVVATRNVNHGAYVGPAGKGSELPLMTIQQQNKLRLSVYVPEQYSGYLKNGEALKFSVKSLPGQDFSATIARMSGALDSKLRSERVEMDVINAGNKLLPGMVAEVQLPLTAKDSTYVVPKSAVVTSSEGIYVISVADHKTSRLPVQKGRILEDKIEVFGAITKDMLLIKQASEEIQDGTPVK